MSADPPSFMLCCPLTSSLCKVCIKIGNHCFHHRASLGPTVGTQSTVPGSRLCSWYLSQGGRREEVGGTLPGSWADRPARGHHWVGRQLVFTPAAKCFYTESAPLVKDSCSPDASALGCWFSLWQAYSGTALACSSARFSY